jgi:hypothetical protein
MEGIVIQDRLAQFEKAVSEVVELLRSASQPKDLALASIERLGPAAACEMAAYWMLDPERRRVRPRAIWSMSGPKVQMLARHPPPSTVSHSENTATQVWRSKKPIWATSVAVARGTPRELENRQGNLESGVWFAVKTETAVYGVIELLGRAFAPRTTANLAVIERLGVRLGHALEEWRCDPPPQPH